MARITAEDCLRHITCRFSLVHAAVRRARQLQRGSKPLVLKKDEKPGVTALREIAAGLVEQIPLSEMEPEQQEKKELTEVEAFEAILESPDLNVQIDTPKAELLSTRRRKQASADEDAEDEREELEGFDEEEEG